MQLKGKTVGILVGPGYEDLEFWVPYMRMQEEGAQVRVIAGRGAETYTIKVVLPLGAQYRRGHVNRRVFRPYLHGHRRARGNLRGDANRLLRRQLGQRTPRSVV